MDVATLSVPQLSSGPHQPYVRELWGYGANRWWIDDAGVDTTRREEEHRQLYTSSARPRQTPRRRQIDLPVAARPEQAHNVKSVDVAFLRALTAHLPRPREFPGVLAHLTPMRVGAFPPTDLQA